MQASDPDNCDSIPVVGLVWIVFSEVESLHQEHGFAIGEVSFVNALVWSNSSADALVAAERAFIASGFRPIKLDTPCAAIQRRKTHRLKPSVLRLIAEVERSKQTQFTDFCTWRDREL